MVAPIVSLCEAPAALFGLTVAKCEPGLYLPWVNL
jgi:hypothetical protein